MGHVCFVVLDFPRGLSKFGQVATNMLASSGNGGAGGGVASAEVAERAAGALDAVLTVAW